MAFPKSIPDFVTIVGNFQWIGLLFIVFWCVKMIYNGVRLKVTNVRRWGVEGGEGRMVASWEVGQSSGGPAGQSRGGPAGQSRGGPAGQRRGGPAGQSRGGPAQRRRGGRVPVPRPEPEGLDFEHMQYTIDLRSLEGIHTAFFSIDFSNYGHAAVKKPSVLSEMDDSKSRLAVLCHSVVSSYLNAVDSLRVWLSEDGKAYHDPYHPVKIVFEYRSDTNRVYSTEFMIYHANLYVYLFKACGKWRRFDFTPYKLISENGDLAENIGLDSSYCSGCYDFVGIPTIIKAIKDLNSGGDNSFDLWKKACLHLVFCFIEAARFRDVEHFVQQALENSFKEGGPFKSQPTTELLDLLIHNWGTLSDALLDFEETGEFDLQTSLIEQLLISGDTAGQQAKCTSHMVPLRLR